MTPLASTAPSAGGAPFDQILIVAGFTTLVYGGVAWLVPRERSGQRTLFGRAAEAMAWPALTLGGLVVALALSVIARTTPADDAIPVPAYALSDGPRDGEAHHHFHLEDLTGAGK